MKPTTVPTDLLEITREDFADAAKMEQDAMKLKAGANAIRSRAERRLSNKLGLGPLDEINLETGAITRAEPDAVVPAAPAAQPEGAV